MEREKEKTKEKDWRKIMSKWINEGGRGLEGWERVRREKGKERLREKKRKKRDKKRMGKKEEG